jgi:glutamyl endopeptidase
MAAASLSKAAHAAVSNRKVSEPPRRFATTAPSFGADQTRFPVNPAGFEALPGYRLPVAAPAVPAFRAMSELTHGAPKLSLASAVRPAQTVVPDTRLYPWRVNAALRIRVPGKDEVFIATGWFAGPCAAITAAHSVYPRESGGYVGWASEIEVVPGQDGVGNQVNGSSTSTLFYCPDGWQSEGDERLDYGVVLLPDDLGSQLGSYGYSTYSDSDLRAAVANLAGYPTAAPDPSEPPGRQWYVANNIADVDGSFVYYDLSTLAGESGAAVYRADGANRYAMAIHTTAYGGRDRGLRIIDPVYDNILQWSRMRAE